MTLIPSGLSKEDVMNDKTSNSEVDFFRNFDADKNLKKTVI